MCNMLAQTYGSNIYFQKYWLFSCCQTIYACTWPNVIRNLQERGTVTAKKSEGVLFPGSCPHTLCHNLIMSFYILLAQVLCICQQRIRAWKSTAHCWGNWETGVTEHCILLPLGRLNTKDVEHPFSRRCRICSVYDEQQRNFFKLLNIQSTEGGIEALEWLVTQYIFFTPVLDLAAGRKQNFLFW